MSDTQKILSFTKKRGRPRINRPSIDTGTPETVMKRLLGTTSEILDLCLEHDLINKKQHWCGIHLRWLYTLRYGVPSVRCKDLSDFRNCESKYLEEENSLWKEAREKEYNEAISELNKAGCAITIVNLCIFNEKPKYLNFYLKDSSRQNHYNYKNFMEIKDGFDVLVKLWN